MHAGKLEVFGCPPTMDPEFFAFAAKVPRWAKAYFTNRETYPIRKVGKNHQHIVIDKEHEICMLMGVKTCNLMKGS